MIAVPKPETPLLIEYFTRLIPTDRRMELTPSLQDFQMEIMSFIFHIQELRKIHGLVWILAPLPHWFEGMKEIEYLRRQTLAATIGVILCKMAAKFRIPVIQTCGILERHPIVNEVGTSSEFFTAGMKLDEPEEETRNRNGTATRTFRDRFRRLINLVTDSVQFSGQLLEKWHIQREEETQEQNLLIVDPTIMHDTY
jgi:hypothetical protein